MQRKRFRLAAVVLGVMVLSIGVQNVGIQPASAHDAKVYWPGSYPNPAVQTVVYDSSSGQCAVANASQNHGYPVGDDISVTAFIQAAYITSTGACNGYWSNFPGGRLAEKGYMYKNGVRCLTGGWIYNAANTNFISYSTDYNYNTHPTCGGGNPWAPGVVTHDLHYALHILSRDQTVYANAPHPTTAHDYRL